MKIRLDLDYVAVPRHPSLAGIAVLVLSLVLGGILLERYREVRLGLDRIEATRGLAADRRPARVLSREKLDEEIKSTEAVMRQLTLPWGTIIETLEEATTPDVAVLQLQPDAPQRQLRVGAEARHREAMLEYVRRLAAAKDLADVHVVSHQVQQEDPQRPIQFTVQALLRSAP